MTHFRPDEIHIHDTFRFGSAGARYEHQMELESLGIRCVPYNRDTEFYLEVAQTPTETDDTLMADYYDEVPYQPVVMNDD